MKALSIRQPWAHLVVMGEKRIENRTWSTRYRGPILVHAGGRWHDEPIERRHGVTVPRDVQLGGIVGIVELVEIVEQSDDPYFVGPFGWVLRNARAAVPAYAWGLGLFDIP
jgi:hypothetical protein